MGLTLHASPSVVAAQESTAEALAKERAKYLKLGPKQGAFPDMTYGALSALDAGGEKAALVSAEARFLSDLEKSKAQKPDNRLTLIEFIACLVRVSFLRANPRYGQYDNRGKKVNVLPGCLKTMLEDFVLPNAKRDTAPVFREQLRKDRDCLAVIKKHKEKLAYVSKRVTTATSDTAESKKNGIKLGFEVWMAMCKGDLWFKQACGSTSALLPTCISSTRPQITKYEPLVRGLLNENFPRCPSGPPRNQKTKDCGCGEAVPHQFELKALMEKIRLKSVADRSTAYSEICASDSNPSGPDPKVEPKAGSVKLEILGAIVNHVAKTSWGCDGLYRVQRPRWFCDDGIKRNKQNIVLGRSSLFVGSSGANTVCVNG